MSESRSPCTREPDARATLTRTVPQTSDEFDSETLGLQSQWEANERARSRSLAARPGHLRLFTNRFPRITASTFGVRRIFCLQKLPAESFDATAAVRLAAAAVGDAVALVAMGLDYSLVRLVRSTSGWRVEYRDLPQRR